MPFSTIEKEALINLKGVGPTVVKRFEEIGINSLEELGQYNADDIAELVASMLNAPRWKTTQKQRQRLALQSI